MNQDKDVGETYSSERFKSIIVHKVKGREDCGKVEIEDEVFAESAMDGRDERWQRNARRKD